jgi:hypothetical protein
MELAHGYMDRIVVQTRVEVVLQKVLRVLIVGISIDQVSVNQEQELLHFLDHAHGSIQRIMKEIAMGIVVKKVMKVSVVKISIEHLNVLMEEE